MTAAKLGLAFVSGCLGDVHFKDTFKDLSKWTPSTWKAEGEMGKFEVKAHEFAKDKDDMSLATTQDLRFWGISAEIKKPFSNEGKTLVVQYSVKYERDVECGGGYLKLGPKMENPEKFGDPTAYNIMFGPDKCGGTSRTHLIFTDSNGKNVLKKDDLLYKQDDEHLSTLYRLVVKPDNTVQVVVNKKEIYSGSLESDWKLLEDKEITDPDDKKPSDWVDEAMIDDPEDKKPSDWVEEKQIVDAEAKKPDDWDEEEDGEWEPPMKDNKDFKGEWKAKLISNPAYKGVWKAKKIPNPEYVANDQLHAYKEFGFVGFDLWQVKGAAYFDNLIIADDFEEADRLSDEWQEQFDHEKKEKENTTTTTTTTPASASSDDDEDKDEDKDEDL